MVSFASMLHPYGQHKEGTEICRWGQNCFSCRHSPVSLHDLSCKSTFLHENASAAYYAVCFGPLIVLEELFALIACQSTVCAPERHSVSWRNQIQYMLLLP